MKKQVKNSIFKSVLLLLSVVLLAISAVIIAVALDTPSVNNPKYLTLNFDPNQISSFTVYHEVGGEMVEHTVVTENGQTVAIESGVKVRVVVIPKNGLWPEFAVEGQVAQTEGCVTQWTSFKNDSVLTVSCTNREYIIHALDYDRRDINDVEQGELKEPYTYTVIGEGWSNSILTSGDVKYRVDDKLELPAVNEDGEDFTFHGWYIITGSGADDVHWIEADETDGKYYIPQSLTMNEYMYKDNGYIYVYPKLIFKSYVINRIDIVHETDFPLHIKTQLHRETRTYTAKELYSANAAEKFWPDDPATGEYKQYAGYYFVESCPATSATVHPQTGQVLDSTENPNNTNVVYRLYAPIVYTLTYYDDDETPLDFDGPGTYTYSHKTEIGQPSRTGYNFAGWKVQVYKNGQWTDEYLNAVTEEGNDKGKYFLGNKYVNYENNTNTFENGNAIYASEANENGDYEIRLIAQWDPIDINITYNLGEGVTVSNSADFLPGGKFASYEYDKGITIGNPVRVGWKLIGWTVTYTNGEAMGDTGLSNVNGEYKIAGNLHTKDITLTAQWERKVYTVVLDGQGADAGFTAQIENVQYGMALVVPDNLVLPQRVGYTFGGYYRNPNCEGDPYIDENGNSKCASWDLDGEEIKLYAKWTINEYAIIIPEIQKIPAGAQIFVVEINDGTTESKPYHEGFKLPYGTEFYVEIVMPDGFKVVTWNDQDVDLSIGATEGNRQPTNVFYSAPHTVGDVKEGITLVAVARPAAPAFGTDVSIDATKSETGIIVEILDASKADGYEVAILGENGELNWCDFPEGSNRYTFEGLKPGTYYNIYVRLKLTQDTLEGVPLIREVNTNYDQHVEDVKDILWGMLADSEKNNETAAWLVIDSIVDVIDKEAAKYPTKPPKGFYDWLDARIEEAQELLVFARFQDSQIAILQAYYNECVASGSFTNENISAMSSKCAQARSMIMGATDEATVNQTLENALAEMKKIRATYLYSDDYSMKLSSLLGLNYGSSISLNSIQDIRALRRAISDAIADGRITADSFITVEEAQELLRTLDTVSAYTFSIINVQIDEGDVFTLTLTVPEALINRTGLQVAYFNQATGMLELLETTREGNTLIFKAKHIADFVILADPNVDLTTVIIALSAILLCQLIAIALVLISRNKAKNSVMHASVALPVFLTVHFLPMANAEFIVLGLGIAVIVAQIVLMWLLLSSGMLRVFKTKRAEPTEQEVTAVVREEDLQEDPYAAFNEESDEVVEEVLDEATEAVLDEMAEEFIEEATEEPVEELTEEVLEEDAFDEELAQELAYEQNEEYADEAYSESDEEIVEEIFPEETEEVYEDEEFIEELPETYYSINEEENVYAYDEEEAERISDAQDANEAPEETADDTGLFEGVFGGSYEQDGYPSDEGGDPRYEEPYGDSYSYADAEDAQTEDADREEAEGQGTVDPYAYVVEDDGEEISDDEEMYRYDE